MKVLILIDGDNFRNTVYRTARARNQYRSMRWDKVSEFVMSHLARSKYYKNERLTLTRTYYYTGVYTDRLISRMEHALKHTRNGKQKKEMQSTLETAKKSMKEHQSFTSKAAKYDFFEIREKELHFNPNNYTVYQKGVDVQLAVDLVELSYKDTFDIVVVVSGDIDLLESVRTAKNRGKHVVIFNAEGATSEEMIKETDLFIDISRFTDLQLDKFSKKS
ncbi:MAG: NYN domain-containing protein [Nanoarchaeota archaeon]